VRSASTLLNGRLSPLLCSAALAFAWLEALAQAHEKRAGAYVLRSSTVASQTLNEATARAHGVDPEPTRAVLDVTVLRDSGGVLQNVRADARASAVDHQGGAPITLEFRDRMWVP
jgi:hypothetical protein